jgi:ferredoxin
LVDHCDRCGLCLTVCPLFAAQDRESSAARGKNALTQALPRAWGAGGRRAQGGELLPPLPDCVANCPNKVATDEAHGGGAAIPAQPDRGGERQVPAVGGFWPARPWCGWRRGAGPAAQTGLNRLAPYGMAPDAYTRSHFLPPLRVRRPWAGRQRQAPGRSGPGRRWPISRGAGCG